MKNKILTLNELSDRCPHNVREGGGDKPSPVSLTLPALGEGVFTMYEWIKTDNEFANAEFRDRLVHDPVLAALIDLLVTSGTVDPSKLTEFVNAHCQAWVTVRDQARREND